MRRVLTAALCLAMMLLACGCTAENIAESNVPSDTTVSTALEASAGTSEETSEEISDESEEQSDTVSEPIPPVIPEERETELEFLFSFDIGMNGVIKYGFKASYDTSHPLIEIPGRLEADADENVYVFGQMKITRLNDGAVLPYSFMEDVLEMKFRGDYLYVLTIDGLVRTFSLADGFEHATLVSEDVLYDAFTGTGDLFDIGGGKLVVVKPDGTFVTLDGEPLAQEDIPFVYVTGDSEGDSVPRLEISETGTYQVCRESQQNPKATYIRSISSEGILLATTVEIDIPDISVGATQYESYDRAGNILSRFVYLTDYSPAEKSCSIPYVVGNVTEPVYTVTSYDPVTVSIDQTVFTDVLTSYVFYGENDAVYLVVYYPNYGEIYRITPGYTNTDLTVESAD